MDISFVIPCYCSEKNLEGVISEIEAAMKKREGFEYEIILVNDNSKDNTKGLINRLSKENGRIIGINFAKNFGQPNALLAGFNQASGKYIMTSDDDGQTPVGMVWDFYDKMQEGYDVVCAKYTETTQKSAVRRFGTKVNEFMLYHMIDKPKEIGLSSFFMAKRFVVKEMVKYQNPYPYIAGLLLRTSGKIGNVHLKQRERATGKSGYNFKKLLKYSSFPEAMKKALHIISKEYDYPVDIEFTANFKKDGSFKINIVQCRPLQTRGLGKTVELPKLEDKNSCLFSSKGTFMGGNVRLAIDYIVFISSEEYIKLPEVEKYNIARQVGIINKKLKGKNAMLMGPGRWGSSNPALGVPVKFTELCNMSVMCEIAYSNKDLMPELSYGSHFFQDLVETGIFYVALFDNKSDVVFNESKLKNKENIVKQIVQDSNINQEVIKVYDTKGLQIYSDIKEQIVTCS